MITDIILTILGITGVTAAALFDIKTKEVPDWLNFSLIISGLSIRLIHSLVFIEWKFFIYGILGLIAMFFLGSLIYYTGQWGGGDAKLLMGLGAIFGTTPYFMNINFHFLLVFLINLVLISAIYGLIWSLWIYLKNYKKVNNKIKQLIIQQKRLATIYLILGGTNLIIYIFLSNNIFGLAFLAIALFFIIYTLLYFFIKAIEEVGMLKWIKPNELREGDWIAKNVYIKKKIITGPKSLGITKKQINQIKKSKIKKILVKEGIAFVPSFFISLIITLMWGNILSILNNLL